MKQVSDRLSKLQKRVDQSDGPIKLSEAIAELKGMSSDFAENSTGKLKAHETNIEKSEQRMNKLEVRFGELEETINFALAEAKKKTELEMKRKEITEFMLKKYAVIQSLMERNEKKITGILDKRIEDFNKEMGGKFGKASEKIAQLKEESEGNKENIDEFEKNMERVDADTIHFMSVLNEQQAQVQNIDWMHDEIMSIKQRELQIINLLKDEADVEQEFLSNISSEKLG